MSTVGPAGHTASHPTPGVRDAPPAHGSRGHRHLRWSATAHHGVVHIAPQLSTGWGSTRGEPVRRPTLDVGTPPRGARRQEADMARTTGERRGLVMVSDPDLLDALLRLAAAAGCELHRSVDATQARTTWAQAPVVLLDGAAARHCAGAGLPRRPGVVVAVRGEPPPDIWRDAVTVGAEHVVSLPQAESWLVGALTEAAEGRPGRGQV